MISTYQHFAGCMIHKYGSKDIGQCLQNCQVAFIGDAVARQLYFGLAHLADPNLPSLLPFGNDNIQITPTPRVLPLYFNFTRILF